MQDIMREMHSTGRGNGAGNQSQDEKSDYDTRSIKSERTPKSIIKKKYQDTQSCYGGGGGGGNQDTESVKKKKKVKWSKEVQNKTKRKKKASYY